MFRKTYSSKKYAEMVTILKTQMYFGIIYDYFLMFLALEYFYFEVLTNMTLRIFKNFG